MFTCGFNKYSQLDKNSNNTDSYQDPIIDKPVKYHADASSFSSFSTNSYQTTWISEDGKCYVTGDNSCCIISGSLLEGALDEDTELFLNDDRGRPYKFVSVHCGYCFTLYLVSDESGVSNFRLVYCYYKKSYEKISNPLFVNIGNRIPRALFGGDHTAGVIDSEGGIIVITNSVLKSPTEKILPTFLPNGEKAVKLACCDKFMISLGENRRVYKSEILYKSKFSEVKELSGKTVVDITGTSDHCFAVLNDGRVFGIGSNWSCKLGLPEETQSVSTFTEIDSLKKDKIISAFAGTYHSIFKTSEGKMIVCGRNSNGQLFIQHKDIVYPPKKVKSFQGFSFCITGNSVSAAFLGIDPPPNIANKKIDKTFSIAKKLKPIGTKIITPIKAEAETSSELESLKKIVSSKDNEISDLKEEIINFRKSMKKKENEISNLKEEISNLKERNNNLEIENKKLKSESKSKSKKKEKVESVHPIKLYTSSEMANFVDEKRIGEGATSEVFEVIEQKKLVKKVLKAEVIKSDESDESNESDDEGELKISIESLKCLMQECETLNHLDHPNIVKTYGFFTGDSTHMPAILLER